MREVSPRQLHFGSDYNLNIPLLQTLQRDSPLIKAFRPRFETSPCLSF